APGFTMSDGVREHPEVVDALRDVSVSARTLQRDQLPEDVVGAVVFLCGPGASFITGQTMVIDGGQYFHCSWRCTTIPTASRRRPALASCTTSSGTRRTSARRPWRGMRPPGS